MGVGMRCPYCKKDDKRLPNNSKINRKNVVNIHLDGRNTLISEAKVPFQAIMK
jgi:hypothetical protein